MPGLHPTDFMNAISFITEINRLSTAYRKHGLHPFSQCTADNRDIWKDGVIYVDHPFTSGQRRFELHDILYHGSDRNTPYVNTTYSEELSDVTGHDVVVKAACIPDGEGPWGCRPNIEVGISSKDQPKEYGVGFVIDEDGWHDNTD